MTNDVIIKQRRMRLSAKNISVVLCVISSTRAIIGKLNTYRYVSILMEFMTVGFSRLINSSSNVLLLPILLDDELVHSSLKSSSF